MSRVAFHSLAERELNDAASYYDFESPGLGRAFLSAVQEACASILDHPEAGASVARSVRRRLVRRFPYALLYSHGADGIRVLAVMSLKRRPMYWVGRE